MERNDLPYRRYILYMVLFLLLSLGVWAILSNVLTIDPSGIQMIDFGREFVTLLIAWAFVYCFFDTYRLRVIANAMGNGHKITFWQAFKITMIHHFVCNVTPFTAGGSLTTVYLLNKHGIELARAISITSIRAFLGSIVILTLLPFAVLGIPLVRYQMFVLHPSPIVWSVVAGFYILVMLGMYSIVFKVKLWIDYINRFWTMLYKRGWIKAEKYIGLKAKTASGLVRFSESIHRLMKDDKKALVKGILASIGYVVTLLTISVILFIGFEYEGETLTVMGLQLIAQFSMYLGFTPGGLGFAEGSYAWIFSQYLGHDRVMSLVFMWRAMTAYLWVAIGSVSLLLEFMKLRKGR